MNRFGEKIVFQIFENSNAISSVQFLGFDEGTLKSAISLSRKVQFLIWTSI